jgi:hypothetical protein
MPIDYAENSNQHRKLPRRSIAVLLVVGICLAVFHSPLLKSVFRVLVVDEPAQRCQYGMLVSTGPDCYDAAAKLLADGSIGQVLIVDQKARRSVRLGALPEYEDRIAKELIARGVSQDQIRVINTQAVVMHQMLRESDRVIRGENDATCLVISTATKSRYFRHLIDQALPADRSDQYRLRAIESRKTDPSAWWKSRSGVRQVMVQGLRLIFVVCFGESEVDPDDPYPQVFNPTIVT